MTMYELMMSFEMGLIYGMVAMGVYLTFRILDIADLTCDGSFVLGAAVAASAITSGIHPVVAMLLAAAAGATAGLITGILHTRYRVTALLSGILVAFMLYSINLRVMHGVPNISLAGMSSVWSHAASAWWVLLAIALLLYAAFGAVLYTDAGLAFRTVGQNPWLARHGGVNVPRMVMAGLMVGNGCIALAGALFAQHQGFADIGSGVGTVIIGFASVMIGERLLPYRSLWVALASCVVGSILYRWLIALALHSDFIGLETRDLNLITGLLIIAIMLLPKRHAC